MKPPYTLELRGAAAALLVSLAGAGFSAQAIGPGAAVAPATPVAQGYEADDHFPGAALLTAIDDDAAAAPGVTGTAALPAGPAPAAAGADPSVQPAAPFRFSGTPGDRMRALQCLTAAIYYEAASEPDAGQRAVAQVVLNRVRHPAFPASVCGVVFQGAEARGCQFSFACDGAMARAPGRAGWARARRVAEAALAGSVFAPVGLATHYHTYAVTPAWNRALVMTGVFGAHFFHRWKGGWGTPAAFGQPYAGREPEPAPGAGMARPAPLATPAPLPATAEAVAAPPEAAPPAGSGSPLPEFAESQILDKWKDSGKPLR